MQVLDLDGHASEWKAKGTNVSKPRPRSSLHCRARELLKERYPTAHISEEVQVCIRQRHFLYIDLYVPLYKIAVEVHGEQHFKFTKHFHKDHMAFLKQRRNDREKAEWCANNEITLIALNFDEDIDEWRSKLN